MSKISSVFKKAVNLDLRAYREGKKNFKIGALIKTAKIRATVCATCPKNQPEPIDELSVEDIAIPEISKNYCEECGCTLPYLLRQNIKSCALKKWEI